MRNNRIIKSRNPTGQRVEHIAFVTQVDLSGTSGQNLYSREVATALANHENIKITIICPEPSRSSLELFNRSDVRIKKIPEKTGGSIYWHSKIQLPTIKALHATHKKKRLDGIVTTLKASNIVPPVFSLLYQLPMVLLVEGMLVKNINKCYPFPGATQLAQLITLANAVRSHYIFTAYSEAEEWIGSLPGVNKDKVTVFHHGVDTELFRPIDKNSARDLLSIDISKSDLVVGFVGSFKPYHCVEELVRSIGALQKRGVKIHLLLVGDGDERQSIEQLVTDEGLGDKTTFTGFVNHEDVPQYIAACDVLYGVIDPNHWGYPMKIHEYLSCGRPVIAYNDEELHFIEDENIGILVNTVSLSALTEAFREFSEMSSSEYRKMSESARKYILNNQTWDTYADRIVEQIKKNVH